MLKLLKIEWLKIKNYKAFIIISSFFTLGIFASNYVVYIFFKNIISESQAGMLIPKFNPYSFDYTWQTTSYATGWILILPALLLIMLVTNEFTYRTNRQNILDGLSRAQFINVKLMLAALIALASTIIVILSALIFGALSGTNFSFNGFSHVGFFFWKSLSYNLLAVLIGVWIRRTGFAIGLYFIYMGAENLVSTMLDGWSMKLRKDGVADLGSMGDYLPLGSTDGLLTLPDNAIKSMMKGAMPTNYTWIVVILSVLYTLFFFWFSRRLIIKKDL